MSDSDEDRGDTMGDDDDDDDLDSAPYDSDLHDSQAEEDSQPDSEMEDAEEDGSENSNADDERPQGRRCWLCENSQTDRAREFHAFLVHNAHSVHPTEMARNLRDDLRGVMRSTLLPASEEILAHIQRHVLHPNVRVAHIMRSLLDLAETLREVVVTRDDNGQPLIDVRTVTVYLKVISEIMQVYRTSDTSRMLFCDSVDS